MFLMSSQVKKSGQCHLRQKNTSTFQLHILLPTASVIVDHAVVYKRRLKITFS
jgi:hypothetical protein